LVSHYNHSFLRQFCCGALFSFRFQGRRFGDQLWLYF
jgi:hypothetical protein